MSIKYRKTLIASVTAALVGAPMWVAAAGDYGSGGQSAQQQDEQMRGQAGTTSPETSPGAASPGATSPGATSPDATSPGATAGAESSTGMSSQLTSMTPNDLQGKEVVTAAGEEVGTVKAIVSDRTQDKPHAVISAGGFLGIGDKEIVVSLDQLQMSGDKLQVSVSEEELKSSPEYMRDQYVEVTPEDQPISEFSAFEAEQSGSGAASSPETGRGTTTGPSGEPLDPADPRQSSDIAPNGDLEKRQ